MTEETAIRIADAVDRILTVEMLSLITILAIYVLIIIYSYRH